MAPKTTRPDSMQNKNRLDIHKIDNVRLGIFREPFDRVGELAGCSIRPVSGDSSCWDFTNEVTNDRGRLLDVAGMLTGSHITMTSSAVAYMVTRQGYTLALLFPGAPRKLKLNRVRFQLVKDEQKYQYPPGWSRDLIARVIRLRFRNIVIIDENYFLSRIGLRN